MLPPGYAATAEQLVERIMALDADKVLSCKSPWDLFAIGLDCSDLHPTLVQASWALAMAKQRLR